jgi:Domain of unknown function (DUF4505)
MFARIQRCGVNSRQLGASRTFSSSASFLSKPKEGKSVRAYRYAIDTHGQLFLHDTVPKNLTSCFKNPEFLNFFFTRIRQNDSEAAKSEVLAELEEEWTESCNFSADQVLQIGRAQGYHWLSPCQGEYNLIRSADSPIVFRELSEDGILTWAGTLETEFDPSALKVDAETGYVYHPSPFPPLTSLQKKVTKDYHPYGAYSLLSSALVLQRLASGLDIDPVSFADHQGGSIEWKGKRYTMGIVQDGIDVLLNRRHRVDDRA